MVLCIHSFEGLCGTQEEWYCTSLLKASNVTYEEWYSISSFNTFETEPT